MPYANSSLFVWYARSVTVVGRMSAARLSVRNRSLGAIYSIVNGTSGVG